MTLRRHLRFSFMLSPLSLLPEFAATDADFAIRLVTPFIYATLLILISRRHIRSSLIFFLPFAASRFRRFFRHCALL